jgi:hypothetical protein
MKTTRFVALMRRVALGALALAALLGVGCGKNRVLLNVDALSFMDASQAQQPYTAPALLPFSVRLPAVPINLVEGFADFGTAQAASLDIGMLYDNQTGQGQSHFTVYFGDDASTVYTTPPVAALDTDLQPAVVTPGSIKIDMDQRVLALFTAKHLFMGLDWTWNPQTAQTMQGTCRVSKLDVHMVSQLSVF